jgi:hypothetical protein
MKCARVCHESRRHPPIKILGLRFFSILEAGTVCFWALVCLLAVNFLNCRVLVGWRRAIGEMRDG